MNELSIQLADLFLVDDVLELLPTEEEILEYVQTDSFKNVLDELTNTSVGGGLLAVDDGPNYHYKNHSIYKRVTKERAEQIGWSVINYIIDGASDDDDNPPIYPNGPVDSVSFFPAGDAGKKTPTNQQDLVGSEAWNKWFTHVTRRAAMVGYELVKSRETRINTAAEKRITSKQSKADAKEKPQISESVTLFEYESEDGDKAITEDLIQFAIKELSIRERPPIKLTDSREDISTTAYYNPMSFDIKIYTKGRALADYLRSVVHELVHHKQNEDGRLGAIAEDGSKWAIDQTDPLETEAHALAGDIITKFKKVSEKNIYLNEAISIDVKIGDTILTGKFKNKKTIVKAIGTDEHGMPTINGRKVVTFRKAKLNENPDWVGSLVQYDERDARAFSSYKGKTYVARNHDTYHDELSMHLLDEDFIDEDEFDLLPTDRDDWEYPGRIWIRRKVISFWKYPPNKSVLLKILKSIERQLKIKIIGNKYKLEIYLGKKTAGKDEKGTRIIKPSEYTGSNTAKGIDIDHGKSPMIKKKKKIQGKLGSEKPIRGARRGETPAQTRNRLGINEDIPSDVLNSFKTQDSLNPKIWNDSKLKSDVRTKLLIIAEEFFEGLEFNEGVKIQDITLTGSISNFNWSKFSDIDLHIRIKFSDIDENEDLVRNLVLAKKTVWNTKHDIKIHGFPVEVFVENIGETHIASGLYSIVKDNWISVPNKDVSTIDIDDVVSKADNFMRMIPILEGYMNDAKYDKVISAIEDIQDKLKRMRQSGLESGGELSVENLAFKALRRSPFIQQIVDMKKDAYDKKMTIEQQ